MLRADDHLIMQWILPKTPCYSSQRILHYTITLIYSEHIKNPNAGPILVLPTINERFWIVNVIREVKKVIQKCVICFRLKTQIATQLMGTLQHDTVNKNRPFQTICIDFAGPILIKRSRVRKSLEKNHMFEYFFALLL